MATEKYFYNSRGDAVPQSYVENPVRTKKGTTLDGDPVYHTTYFDAQRKKHISYDTVFVNGEHHYIMGSGHERDHDSKKSSRWDSGNTVTWQDALRRRTSNLIR